MKKENTQNTVTEKTQNTEKKERKNTMKTAEKKQTSKKATTAKKQNNSKKATVEKKQPETVQTVTKDDIINAIFKIARVAEYETHERQNRVIFTYKNRRAFMIRPEKDTVTLYASDEYSAFEDLIDVKCRCYDEERKLNMKYKFKMSFQQFIDFVNVIA